MIILGIDPGTTSIGYAVLDCTNRREPRILEARLLSLVSVALEDRLMTVHSEIKKIITQWHPHAASVEKLFFAKNTKTAIAVSETRGVILLTAHRHVHSIWEYTPLEVKLAVAGHGRAAKADIRRMLQLLLPRATVAPGDDTADAVAIALTAFYTHRYGTYPYSKGRECETF